MKKLGNNWYCEAHSQCDECEGCEGLSYLDIPDTQDSKVLLAAEIDRIKTVKRMSALSSHVLLWSGRELFLTNRIARYLHTGEQIAYQHVGEGHPKQLGVAYTKMRMKDIFSGDYKVWQISIKDLEELGELEDRLEERLEERW